MTADTVFRIGELSRRSGVSPELLRAWERRYGLLQPNRTSGGLRLYSLDDLERVRVMRGHLAAGVAAAEAARLAARPDVTPTVDTAPPGEGIRDELAAALDSFDEPRAQAVLDELLATSTVDTLLSSVVIPYLHDLGERWERGEASIAQEHFATSVLRGRMLGLARGWGRGLGPLALLACLPGEQHELGLIAFGVAMSRRGWRIAYLGADTPLETVSQAADSLTPELVVLSTVTADRVRPIAAELRKLGERHRLALAGTGAAGVDAAALGATPLPGDPAEEADRVTALRQAAPSA